MMEIIGGSYRFSPQSSVSPTTCLFNPPTDTQRPMSAATESKWEREECVGTLECRDAIRQLSAAVLMLHDAKENRNLGPFSVSPIDPLLKNTAQFLAGAFQGWMSGSWTWRSVNEIIRQGESISRGDGLDLMHDVCIPCEKRGVTVGSRFRDVQDGLFPCVSQAHFPSFKVAWEDDNDGCEHPISFGGTAIGESEQRDGSIIEPNSLSMWKKTVSTGQRHH